MTKKQHKNRGWFLVMWPFVIGLLIFAYMVVAHSRWLALFIRTVKKNRGDYYAG